jgi:cytochrome oxidase Cu insertion factor (SCO1/SenC/PrrC family)
MSTQSRKRLTFWIAATLFLGPFIAAFVIYYGFPQLLPTARTNYGRMINPPQPLPALTLANPEGEPVEPWKGHWTLVYVAPLDCEDACRERTHFGRQLWLSLNEKRVKLQRLYIAPDAESAARARGALAEENADLVWLAGTGTAGYDLRRFFEMSDTESLYLVDPFGNWLMTYAPTPGADGQQKDFKGMQKDLNKLLKL